MSTTHAIHASPPRRITKPLCAIVALTASAALLAGCSALEPDAAGAQRVTDQFLTALASGDGETACAQLTDSAREDVEDQSQADCAEGVLTVGVDSDTTASPAEVYSRAAFVETGATAVFLTPGDDGWLIRAAGCEPVEKAPFDCAVDGS